jgi:hypothetical protein
MELSEMRQQKFRLRPYAGELSMLLGNIQHPSLRAGSSRIRAGAAHGVVAPQQGICAELFSYGDGCRQLRKSARVRSELWSLRGGWGERLDGGFPLAAMGD